LGDCSSILGSFFLFLLLSFFFLGFLKVGIISFLFQLLYSRFFHFFLIKIFGNVGFLSFHLLKTVIDDFHVCIILFLFIGIVSFLFQLLCNRYFPFFLIKIIGNVGFPSFRVLETVIDDFHLCIILFLFVGFCLPIYLVLSFWLFSF